MDNSYVIFDSVQKTYDKKKLVVKDFNLKIKKGEFLTMLGPSGSGKTTCLMMLAGFESISNGTILLNGKEINDIAPHKRNIGVVFQNYALFPHMTLAENLAYPLQIRKINKEIIKEKVTKALDLVGMLDFENRYPTQLSGGQKQRIALARVLIYEPEIILMDEPLGALDKQLRELMQYEIKKLHDELKLTIVYITHDQTEALTMSDRIVIFNDGIAQQIDEPMKLYEKPNNSFVANFMGENNQFSGVTQGSKNSDDIVDIKTKFGVVKALNINNYNKGVRTLVSIRPEKIMISLDSSLNLENKFNATIKDLLYIGDYIRVVVNIEESKKDFFIKHSVSRESETLIKGQKIQIGWNQEDCRALDWTK